MILASTNGQLCLHLTRNALEAIEQEVAIWHPKETGGILIGSYDSNYRLAVVEVATPAPSDSLHGASQFTRGEAGIIELLAGYKIKIPSLYYLGEWHSHPNNSARASFTDIWQMNKFASQLIYGASSPALLIVGGSLSTNLRWRASIHKKWKKPIYLSPIN